MSDNSLAQALIRNGHQVTMVCGSFGAGQTGLNQAFENGMRRGVVDGIEIIEFETVTENLAQSLLDKDMIADFEIEDEDDFE